MTKAAWWLRFQSMALGRGLGLLRVRPGSWPDVALNALPRGVSQVCFMDNSLTGLICFIALVVPMPLRYFLCSLVGLVSSTLVGRAFALPRSGVGSPSGAPPASLDALSHGLYGFNGQLVGAALATFGDWDTPGQAFGLLALTAVTAGAATVLSCSIGRAWTKTFDLPTFTMPFNLSTLIVLAALGSTYRAPSPYLISSGGAAGAVPVVGLRAWKLVPSLATPASAALTTRGWATLPGTNASTSAAAAVFAGEVLPPAAVDPGWRCWPATAGGVDLQDVAPASGPGALSCGSVVVRSIFRGVAQVYFCDAWGSGLALVLAFALCSPVGAMASLIGSGVGMGVGALLGAPPWELQAGLWGYNGVIGAMSVCGVFYCFEWLRGIGVAVACVATCTVLQGAFKAGLAMPAGLPVLTLPFCCGAIVWLLVGWPRRLPVPQATTPEENAVEGTLGMPTLRRWLGIPCGAEAKAGALPATPAATDGATGATVGEVDAAVPPL